MNKAPSMERSPQRVFIWIILLCTMVLTMVVIGGVTRLTGSGLSIVEWQPLMGAIPPLNQNDWLDVFGRYQSSPQYQLVNKGMSLSQFQWIFFWEYFHRLVGRLLGFVFFIPWMIFWLKGYFNRPWALRFLGGFLLGGLQGLMGWLMVASGLVDKPHVSHYRLAAHLLLAFGILAYFWKAAWAYLEEHQAGDGKQNSFANSMAPTTDQKSSVASDEGSRLRHCLNGALVLLIAQIIYGAFVAGLKAGFMYNTFPAMEGQFFPSGGLVYSPLWRNFLENPLTVQWVHRSLGWSLLIFITFIWWRFHKVARERWDISLKGLLIFVLGQFTLGVLTLISKVNLPLAVFHQVGAALVLLFLLWTRWELRKKIEASL